MIAHRLRVLKAMNEATGHIDFNEFAKLVGMPASEIMMAFHELAKTGHLKKVGSGYGMTGKGKAAVKATVPVPVGEEFQFYFEIGKPSGQSAAIPIEFYEIANTIDPTSLEFHTRRGDFEMWVRNTLGNPGFADELAAIKESGLSGEALRRATVNAFESAFNFL